MFMDRKIIVIAGIALAVLLAGGAGFFLFSGKGGGDSVRKNTLALAADYMKNGEYQRALDLLDKLLIAKADDPESMDRLREVYPDGFATLHASDIPGRDFYAYVVLPE